MREWWVLPCRRSVGLVGSVVCSGCVGWRRGIVLGTVCPVLGSGRGWEVRPVFTVHLAVEAAAAVAVAAAA